MKYFKRLPVSATESVNRSAWVSRLGRAKNAEDVTEFLCPMMVSEDGSAAELHISPEDEQYFTAAQKAQFSDTQTIFRE